LRLSRRWFCISRLLRSCGRSWPDHELRIAGEDGQEVPDGEVGELMARPADMR